MKNGRLIWVGMIFLALAAAGGWYVFHAAGTAPDSGQDSNEPAIQQALARRGDLAVSVSGAGELVPASSIELGFQEKGELVELNVQPGDAVKAGDILARLEVDRTPAELQAEIASAELAVLIAEQNLDQLYENVQLVSAKALSALEAARIGLADVDDNGAELAVALQQVAHAKEDIADAELKLSLLNSSPSQEAMSISYSSLLFKEKDLQELRAQVAKTENKIKSAPNKMIRDRLKTQLVNLELRLLEMQSDYDSALYRYETINDPADPLELSVAEAQLSTAQAQLDEAIKELEQIQAGARSSTSILAEAQLTQAQDEWDQVKDGPDPRKEALASAELAQAQARLDVARQQKLIVDLVSPRDAVVVDVSATVGDRIANQPIVTLAEMGTLQVEAYIDETDGVLVETGNRAVVVFDALPDKTFEGQIAAVDPSLQGSGNTQAVQALVRLDSAVQPLSSMPLGLNATIEIIAAQVENAVLVPLEALQGEAEDGYYVYVIEGESLEKRPVEAGLMDLTTVVIVSGLQPGEAVAIGGQDLSQE